MDTICCELCEENFTYRRNLKRHLERKHSSSAPTYKCDRCVYSTNTKYNFLRHKSAKHGSTSVDQQSRSAVQGNVKCPLCTETRQTRAAMVNHFVDDHKLSLSYETLEFTSEEEFKVWKLQEEKKQKCEFVTASRRYVKATDGSLTVTFRCHRDGNFKSAGENKRHMKVLGSNKINGHCPAKIETKIEVSGKTVVSYCKSHVGHQGELGRMRLTESERMDLSSKIATKIPFDTILDEIRNNVGDGTDIERLHLVTRKDLINIEQQCNLNSEVVRHRNDCTSVESWVKQMEEVGGVVRFYKGQGSTSETEPQLNLEDFVLIIMNETQREMLEHFGKRCVSIDSTHGINSYDIELTTLLTVDEKWEGFPCAFMLSNRLDTSVLQLYFRIIRNFLSEALEPQVFMSDMAETFYNAWLAVMKPPKFRLYCAWHVDRAWRKNLTKIRGREKQMQVYKLLRVLMEERDISAFNRMLDPAITDLKTDPDTVQFGIYFEENYKDSAASWAYCHRLHAGLNTNMHLERMNGIVKHIYMHGKNPKRLDIGIHVIMRFVRDKMFERLVFLHKSKVTNKLSLIRQRHAKSLTLSPENIVFDNETWKIPSRNNKEIYEVTKSDSGNCSCHLRCLECKLCIHAYVCSCYDSSIKFNMCKHIHLLGLHLNGNTVAQEDARSDLQVTELPSPLESETILNELRNPHKRKLSDDVEKGKAEVRQLVERILSEVHTSDDVAVVKKQFMPALSILHAQKQNRSISVTPTTSSSSKFQPQRKLFSTKKHRKRTSLSLQRPDEKERDAIAANLLLR